MNPTEIKEAVRKRLEPRYELCYVDCRDSVEPDLIYERLKAPDTPFEDVFAEQRTESAVFIIDGILQALGCPASVAEDFKDTDEHWDLVCEVIARDRSTPYRDLLRQSTVHCRVMLLSNYDCWLPLWEARGLYGTKDALTGMMRILSLNPAKVKEEALRQGIDCYRRFPDLKSREGKEIVTYRNFVNCLRACPNYGLWTFFGTFDLTALHDSRFRTDDLVIPAGTTATMFNDWNGGGSLEFAKTIRPVTVRELRKRGATQYDTASVLVDEMFRNRHGYSSGSVYGRSLSEEKILVR